MGTPWLLIWGMKVMNIFSNLRKYAGKWSVKEERAFSAEEIAAVKDTKVVSSDYGYSVMFMMNNGGYHFIPLSENSLKTVGESIDLSKAKLLTLERQGNADIFRVEA